MEEISKSVGSSGSSSAGSSGSSSLALHAGLKALVPVLVSFLRELLAAECAGMRPLFPMSQEMILHVAQFLKCSRAVETAQHLV